MEKELQFETKIDKNNIKQYATGAQRSENKGKGRFDLIPPEPERRVAIKYEQGALGYGEWNWESGMPFSRLVDSAKRHLNQYVSGDRTEDHLAAACWNLFAIMHFEMYKPELDDLKKFDDKKLSGPQT